MEQNLRLFYQFRKNQRNDIKIFKVINKSELNWQILNQLNKLKSSAKNKTWKILTINKKNFEDKELPHEL